MTNHAKYLLAVGIAFAVSSAAHAAQGDKIGETQMCIDSHVIDQTTPVARGKAIVVKMRGPGPRYKRIDLVNGCGLDRSKGFAYSSTNNRLCIQDALKVVEPV